MGGVKIYLLTAVFCLAMGSTAYPFCFEEAGTQYGINPQILRAIAKVESNFNPAAVNVNRNGSYDVGLMQVNSIWAPTLGKERWQAQGDACFNTKTGAWILAMCMSKYGYTWKGIGCYNSQTPEKSERYSRMVFKELRHVHPVAQEKAYAQLKDRLETAVRDRVDGWVEQTAQASAAEKTDRTPPDLPIPREALQEPPALSDANLVQSALSLPQDAALAPVDGSETVAGLQ